MFDVDKLNPIPAWNRHHAVKVVRYWDKAGTQGAGARTAGVMVAKMKSGRFVIAHCKKGQWAASQREPQIKLQAMLDDEQVGKDPLIKRTTGWMEQEPGSGGKDSVEASISGLAGFNYKADRVSGDKVTRAEPLSAQVAAGNVDIVLDEWTQDFLDEMQMFPHSKFKDQVDAAAGAFNKCNSTKKVAGIWGTPRRELNRKTSLRHAGRRR